MLQIKFLTIKQANKTLLAQFNAEIASGEILTLMGASGSGKSTLLQWMIGGLDPAFSAQGELWLDQRRVDQLSVEQRRIGILFQDDLLFAHLSIGQNLAFALPAEIKGKALRRETINQHLAEVGLAGFYDRDPTSLSGGQRTRVSMLRALLAQPKALLLDEPFSKLDAVLREQFRDFVYEKIAQMRIPTVLVTHDLADVPKQGKIVRIEDLQHA
ncbi:MAG: ATP-binding cassette domain-containing protein [Vibrionaceae bacterium]